MDAKTKHKLIRDYINCYNSFDIEGMLSNLHSDVKFENIVNDEVTDRAENLVEFKILADRAKELFSFREQTIKKIDTEADRMVVEIDYSGVLAVDLPNGLQAGQKLNFKGKSEFYFKEGKISKIVDVI
ncbi:hypothetical protein CKA32_001205 [Geitlerinema sp. FC II]|nr:hypothetical protein CKA32_001205 [Geitlerinema sp. FC II]